MCIILAVVWAHDVMAVGKVDNGTQTRCGGFSDISGCLGVNASTGRRSKARWELRWGCGWATAQPQIQKEAVIDGETNTKYLGSMAGR